MAYPRLAVVTVLRLYQRFVSPALGPRCRYAPSCSRYMLEAVETFGVLRGVYLGCRRVLRCHPWAAGGVDEVPAVFRLRRPHALRGRGHGTHERRVA